MCSSCGSYDNVDRTPSVSGDIVDYDGWYTETIDRVLNVYINVPVPNEYYCAPYDDHAAPIRPCTLEDVYGDIDSTDDYKPELHVKMYTDFYESNNSVVNAEFKQKGKSTRRSKLKSYRVVLDDDKPLYNEEGTLQLNKHPNDYARIKQMMSFELFKDIPNFTSLKTLFYRLWINDVDYGLYTHVENVDEIYLRNRGWNEQDKLYKTQNFAFRVESGMELDSKGEPINREVFEAVIEPQTGDDHSKLITMLNAINENMSDEQFTQVFEKYFNRQNYITWMAVNLVLANKDTVSQNFYLYNPLYSDKFYFLPWDYDGISRATEKYAKWELGIGTWWGISLHNKFLKIKANREELDVMVDNIRNNYITDAKVQMLLDKYKPLIEPFILRNPDNDVLSESNWLEEFNIVVPRISENVQNYKSQIGSPMPFWQGMRYQNGVLTLTWEESIDFEGDAIVYDILCADNVDFNNSIVNLANVDQNSSDLNVTSWGDVSYSTPVDLSSGDRLFMKIVAKEKYNPSNYQIAFDKAVEIDGIKYFGVLEVKLEF